MPNPKPCSSCRANGADFCAPPCGGYGSTAVCPPLIVLAVLAAEQIALPSNAN